MEPKDRIIAALDVDSLDTAEDLVKQLARYVGMVKVGLELLTTCGAPGVAESIHAFDGRVFYDGKFKDIPNTVAAAVRAVVKLRVNMLNVHCLGGPAMMKAATDAAADEAEALGISKPTVLGVTILTSLNDHDLRAMGVDSLHEHESSERLAEAGRGTVRVIVGHLARLAKECGLDGVIASPQEITDIRESCGPNFLIVTPGVRPEWYPAQDQKRVMTPGEAIKAGADYLVIGRPITKPPKEIGSPAEAAKRIAEEIREALLSVKETRS